MAGLISTVQKSRDGKPDGFIIHDEAGKACMYHGFSSWHEADSAARQA